MTKQELKALIEKTKAKYPQSKILQFRSRNGFECIVRSPDRNVLMAYMRHANNPEKANDILIKNCVLTEQETVLANDSYYFGVSAKLTEFIPAADFEAVELEAVKL